MLENRLASWFQHHLQQRWVLAIQTIEPLRTLGQWGRCADQSFGVQLALGQQIQALRVFAPRSTRTKNRQLPRDGNLQRKFDFGGHIPHENSAAAFAKRLQSKSY